MKRTLFLCFLLGCLMSNGQSKVLDSLITSASKQETDSLKIDQLHKYFFKYVYSKPEVARSISEYTIANTTEESTPFQLAQALIRKGIYYDVTSKKDSAILLYDQAFEIAAPRKDYISMGNVYNDKGLVYWNQDKLELAMKQYVQGAKVFEKIKYDRGLSSIYNNMGLILYDLDRYEEAKSNHLKALNIRQKLNDRYGLGASYSNLSNAYKRLGKNDSVTYYMRKAIQIKKKSNDQRGLAIAYQNLGIDFRESKVLDSAIYYTSKAEKIYDQINNKRLRVNSLVTLAEMYQLDSQFSKGIVTIKEAISLIAEKEHKRLAEMEVIHGRLLAYQGNHKESATAYARALKHKDAYREFEVTAQAQEYYEKYETAQKEQEIAQQRAQLAEGELAIERNRRTIYALIGGALLLSLLGFLYYRQQKIKSLQKAKENELQLALAKIENQNQLQDQRLRISRDLHDNIGSQLTFLISSIDNLIYAKNLDREITGDKLDSLSDFTRNTMGELRDTIWAMNKKEITLNDIENRTTTLISHLNGSLKDQTKFTASFSDNNDVTFDSVKGMHIFRIIQEAINNAVKYAAANEVIVKTKLDKDLLTIDILDNGKGFDLDGYVAGNGIKNMKERIASIDGEIKFSSIKNKGTTITLLIPR